MPIYKPYSSARLLKFCQDISVVLEKKEGEEEREGRKQRRRIVAIKGADLYTRYLHKQSNCAQPRRRPGEQAAAGPFVITCWIAVQSGQIGQIGQGTSHLPTLPICTTACLRAAVSGRSCRQHAAHGATAGDAIRSAKRPRERDTWIPTLGLRYISG